MDFINIICNVILSVIFAASFICIFFFTYVKDVERQIVLDNLKYVVSTLLSTPIELLKSAGLYDINKLSELIPTTEDDYNADKTVMDNNNKLMKKSYTYIGILLGVGLFIVLLLSIYKHGLHNKKAGLMYFFMLILKNLLMVSGIGIAELIFLISIGANYKVCDNNVIIKGILVNLNKLDNQDNYDHFD